MALNSKYVTLPSIIDKIYRDNGYDTEISYDDAAEWAAEAMDIIAVPMSYIDKHVIIPITNYRGTLPCDFHNITEGSVINCDNEMPLRATTNTAYLLNRVKELESVNYTLEDDSIDPTIGEFQIDQNGYPIIPDDIDYLRTKQANKYIYRKETADTVMEEYDTYLFNNNFIFTTIKDGNIRMFYKAFPVDNSGYPIIPDDVKYIRAVSSYIVWKIDYKLYRLNKINKDIVDKSEQEWLWAVGSAGTKARLLTLDEVESFKNMTVRLLPKFHEHLNTYQYLGNQESLNFRNTI